MNAVARRRYTLARRVRAAVTVASVLVYLGALWFFLFIAIPKAFL